jgi:uncharacterized protein (TIGR00730 family)
VRVGVFCGANQGRRAVHAALAEELAAAVVARGDSVVYGGGRVGLMGLVADGVLRGGGEVLGVIPQMLVDLEQAHPGLTRLEVVDGMHQRKARMFALSDVLVVLPGGIGTLDELAEALTWRHLGIHSSPIGLLDVDGFFAPLLGWLERAHEDGFLRFSPDTLLLRSSSPAGLLELLAAARAMPVPPRFARPEVRA